jgi:hypothetical protein
VAPLRVRHDRLTRPDSHLLDSRLVGCSPGGSHSAGQQRLFASCPLPSVHATPLLPPTARLLSLPPLSNTQSCFQIPVFSRESDARSGGGTSSSSGPRDNPWSSPMASALVQADQDTDARAGQPVQEMQPLPATTSLIHAVVSAMIQLLRVQTEISRSHRSVRVVACRNKETALQLPEDSSVPLPFLRSSSESTRLSLQPRSGRVPTTAPGAASPRRYSEVLSRNAVRSRLGGQFCP